MTEAQERLEELYKRAVGRFLDKQDVDVMEYLDEAERVEYRDMYVLENNECPFCGDTPEDCECEEKHK